MAATMAGDTVMALAQDAGSPNREKCTRKLQAFFGGHALDDHQISSLRLKM